MSSCSICNKVYSSKYTRDKHITRVHGDESAPVQVLTCLSDRCSYQTRYGWELKKHMSKCMHVQIDQALSCQQQEFEKLQQHNELLHREELTKKDIEIRRLLAQLEVVEARLEKADEMVAKCIERPVTTNNHNHVHHILVDGKTFVEHTDPRRIEEIARKNMESYFWQGQAGVAKFLYDHVICVDGEDVGDTDRRMLIACTDYARKKMKYTNEKNEVEEDIGACKFISKVAQPICAVSGELHSSITQQLREDQRAQRIDLMTAECKSDMADQAFMDISQIQNDQSNHSFTSKLCSLTKV